MYNKYANRGQTNLVNQIPDFSNAGYKGGGVRLPDIPVAETVTAIPGDCRQLIQDAIDRVSVLAPDANGYRGAVLLKAGIYPVEGSLTIKASGVVLRGEGNGVNGTVLIATQKTQHDFILMEGTGSGYAAVSGSRFRLASAYVPTGTKIVEVVAGHNFQVGDNVVLQKTPNDAWINVLNMAQYGWTASAYRTTYERKIVAIEGNTLTLDIPVMDPIEPQYGGGEVYKSNVTGRINNCGVENMRIESYFASRTDESHGWSAVLLSRVENSWVRNVVAKFFGFGAVNITNMSRFNTIEDCAMIDPVSQTTGGRKYSFNLESNSTSNLIQRCMAWGGRHDYVSGSKVPGPNVFLDCVADNTFDDIGPHHRYATGQIYDNIYGGQIRVQNRGASGSGHGWAGAQVLLWNCRSYKSDIEVESPPTGRNWGIGCIGLTQTNTGYWESWGTNVLPRSLYLQQLQDRLGASAVTQIATADQINNVLRQKLLTRGRAIAAEPQVFYNANANTGAFDLTDNGGILTAQYTTTSRPDQTYEKIIDNDYTTAYYQSGRNALWVQYRSSVPAVVTRYTITSSFEVQARDPVDWNLQGSNNGTSWTTIDTRTGEVFPTRSLTRTFQINNTQSFTFYRLNITKNAGNANTQFNEWELFQRKQQQISVGALPPLHYGDEPAELIVSAGSGLPVTLAVVSGPGSIVDSNFLKIEGTGNILIRVTQAGNENYFPATKDFTVVVNKGDQAIEFPALSAKVYGDPDFDLSATSDSKLPVTYTSSDPSIASITSGNKVHISKAGQVIITATQAGSPLYNAADPIAQLLIIDKRALTITALPQEKEYGSANPALTASFEGFVDGEDAQSLTAQPVLATDANAASPVGIYPISVSGAASPNYAITFEDGTLTIRPKQLVVTADNKQKQYGSPNPTLTASYDGFVNGDSAATLTAQPVLATVADPSSPVGQYPITLSGGISGNYSLVLQEGVLTVTKASLTISAEDKNKTYGSANPPLTVAYEGFVNGDDAASLTAQPIITTAGDETAPVGQYPITVSGAASDNYEITYEPASLSITQAGQSISFSAIADRFEGDPAFDLDASSTSGLPVSIISSDPSVASVSGKTVTIHSPGTVTFTAGQDGNNNFAAAPDAAQTLTVAALPVPTITATGPVSFCPGGSVLLTSSEAASYRWLLDGSGINQSERTLTATSSGSYQVEVTYSNGLKKTSSPFAIVVNDVDPPTVVAKNVTVVLDGGSATASPSDLDNGSYDNCSALTFTLSKTNFDCSNIGENTVVLTATDAAGNSSSVTATVTVAGTVPTPVIAITKSNTTFTGLADNTIALGYGAQTLILSSPSGANTYIWSGSSSLSATSGNAVGFAPTSAGNYTIVLTAVSPSGCSASTSTVVEVLDVRCGNKLEKVVLCKRTGSGTNSFVELCVGAAAVEAHLTQGATLGTCTQANGATTKTTQLVGADSPLAKHGERAIPVDEEKKDDVPIVIYPNPTQGVFSVKVEDRKDLPYRFILFDALGRQIKSASMQQNPKTSGVSFDLEGRTPGLYFLYVSDGKNVWVRKITKM
ncbi:hypothetical protein GCM10023184_18930 [Flaviaesturariibacter amylovorans]|uniref:T9SS type A sorting domain-containing protein n=1 Tax=Flaviaesturariibacter amylovorans TaxID=1084520 RepID=A0ABP8GRR7_9BACT